MTARKETYLIAVRVQGEDMNIIVGLDKKVRTMVEMRKLIKDMGIIDIELRILRDTGEVLKLESETTVKFVPVESTTIQF